MIRIINNIIIKIKKRIISASQASENNIIINVFKSNYKKRVLLSYLKEPFIEGIKHHHTNYMESYTAGKVFHELEYSVDVISYIDNYTTIEYSNYEIVYGFGFPLEKAFYAPNSENLIKILYSTGCNLFYSNKVTSLKVNSFFKATGILLPESSRVGGFFWTFQYTISDLIIALGNKFVANTFLEINPNVKCLPLNAFYFDFYDIDLDRKDFDVAKKHFLWFGSTGLLHKGLDIVINIFSKRTDLVLHICGASKSEKGFWLHYQPIISECDNINEYGFVDLQSEQFRTLMNLCCFCIFPSVSEGGAPSLLNAMANGALIPIASKACGIDLENIGYVFEDCEEVLVENKINEALTYDIITLKEKSINVKKQIRQKYSYQNYHDNLKKHITEALQDNNISEIDKSKALYNKPIR